MNPNIDPLAVSATSSGRHPYRDTRGPKGHLGWIVACSLAAGLVAALLLVAASFIPPTEAGVTGAFLCGLALGWATLTVLSLRSDQPQPWAAAPALFMGLSGLLLVAFGSRVHEVLTWVWPPALLALVIWMAVRVRRQLRSPSGRWLLYPLFGLLALASVGGGYQAVREVADARANPMPGQLVDVGEHRLHLSCTGAGSPTVVLEPGAGGVSSDLELISGTVSRDTRVCVYDRAGRGWSEPDDTPQDAKQVATDLHTLLHRGAVAGPYVLAGHSFGGLYTLTFAARYPGEVAGMVLVDSTAPASATSPRPAPPTDVDSYDLTGRVSALASTSARLGLGRLVGVPTASHLRSTIDEYVNGARSTEHAASLRDFGDRPLVVLTAGTGSDADWIAGHDELANLSTNGTQRVIERATHQSLIAEQEGSAATTRAILDVVSSVRTSESLD